MRRLVLALILANAMAFAWGSGWFSSWFRGSREPEIVAQQQNADRLRPVPLSRLDAGAGAPVRDAGRTAAVRNSGANPATPSRPTASPASPGAGSGASSGASPGAPLPAATQQAGTSATSAPSPADPSLSSAASPGARAADASAATCQAFAALDEERAARLREALVSSGAAVDEQRVEQGASYLVYLPPSATLADAQRRLADLRRIGRDDAFLIQDGPLRLAISIGVFRAESVARAFAARIAEAGESDVVVAPRAPIQVRIRLQARWRDADAAAIAAMLGAQFDAPVRDCS